MQVYQDVTEKSFFKSFVLRLSVAILFKLIQRIFWQFVCCDK